MKRLFWVVLLVLIAAATSWGQKRTMVTDKSVVREELLLNGDTLSGVEDDTLLQFPSKNKVPSTEVLQKYAAAKTDIKYHVYFNKSLISSNSSRIQVGDIVRDMSTGMEYLVQNDSVAGLSVDGSYQFLIATGKYGVVRNGYSFYFTDKSVAESVTRKILEFTDNVNFILTLTDTVTFDRSIEFPHPDSLTKGKVSFSVVMNQNDSDRWYYVSVADQGLIALTGSDRYTATYYLKEGTKLPIDKSGSFYNAPLIKSVLYPQTVIEFQNSRYAPGDIVYFRGGKYAIVYNPTASILDDTNFVIPVKQLVPFGENLASASQEVYHTRGSWSLEDGLRSPPVGNSDPLQNLKYGPDGSKTADALCRCNTGGTRFNLFISEGDTPELSIGDQITVSVDLLRGDASSNWDAYFTMQLQASNTVFVTDLSPSFMPDTTRSKWVNRSYTFTVNQSVLAGTSLKFVGTTYFDIQDTMYATNWHVERTAVASDFKYTGPNDSDWFGFSDVAYAVLQTENEHLSLDDIYAPVLTNSQTPGEDLLTAAFNYCGDIPGCNGVAVPNGYNIDDNFVMPEQMTLMGVGGNTNVDLNPTDSTVAAINYDVVGTYADRITIKNINFNVKKRCTAAISTNASFKASFENVEVNGNNLCDYGINVGQSTGSGAIYTVFTDCVVLSCLETGYNFTKAGNIHTLRDCIGNVNKVGIGGSVIMLNVHGGDFEANDSLAFDFYNSRIINFHHTYLENTVIKIRDTYDFGFYEGRFSGGSIALNNVKNARIERNGVYSGGIVTADENTSMTVSHNWFQSQNDLNEIINDYRYSQNVEICSNYGDSWEQEKCLKNRISSYEGQVINGHLRGKTIISDTIVANDLHLKGIDQNIANNRDSFGVEGFTSYYEIQNNTTPGPYPGTQADLFIGTANLSGTGSFGNIFLSETVNIGDQITLFYAVKNMSTSGNRPGTRLIIRVDAGSGVVYDRQMGPFVNTEWTIVPLTIDSVEANITSLTRRLVGVNSGDSLAFYQVGVVKGIFELSSENLGAASGNNTSDVKLTIHDSDNIAELVGGLKIAGELQDSDGDSGTSGQLLKSTGDGTNWGNADAGNVDISDIAGGYASTSVEGALQELTMQTEIAPSDASTIAITKYRCIIAIDNLEGSTQTQTINTANIPDGAEVFIKSNASVSVTFSLSSGNFVPLGSTTGQSTISISGTGELKLLWSSDLNVFYQML